MKNQTPDFYQNFRYEMRERLQHEIGPNHKWAEYLLVAPDLFHLLCRLSTDEAVPLQEKMKLVAAIAYFVSPLDLIPGFVLGPVGYVDDIALAAYVLNSLMKHSGPNLIKKHWAGEGDVLEIIQATVEFAERTLGGGFLKKFEQLFR